MQTKERMCQSNTKVKYLSKSLKHKVLDHDYEAITDMTYKTKGKRYIKKRKHIFMHKIL